MPNVRNQTSAYERISTLLKAYAPLNTYLKEVYTNRNKFYELIPDVLAPCIVLNDKGETFLESESHPMTRGTKNKVKTRIYHIEITCVYKYIQEESVLIGNAETLGVIDFSHLVENALNSDKTLVNTMWDLEYAGWDAVDILDNENDSLFAIARQTTLEYTGKPEEV